jgi:hypothetical protein
MNTAYDEDIAGWALEQAELLRAGQLQLIDTERIAEVLIGLGLEERRGLASRFVALLEHLLKWQYDPERRGAAWRNTILVQRRAIGRMLVRTPSLRHVLEDGEWQQEIWDDAVDGAAREAGLDPATLPQCCPWSMAQLRDEQFLPPHGG